MSARQRLPIYTRVQRPPPMHFMARDSRILQTLHAFDGMMADYQIRRVFFTGARQARGRLSKLFHHGYLARPDRRRRAGLPCMVYWLDRRGAAHVASLSGQTLATFRYRQQPRWALAAHDLAVNDFRLDVAGACPLHPDLELMHWTTAGEFWARPDVITYTDAQGRARKRGIRPDAFFVIRQGQHHHRLLLELDRATEDHPRFGREKVRPGVAYLRSQVYRRRSGYRTGRWVVVTTSQRRMQRMKEQAEREVGKDARVFWFTTFDRVAPQTVLTAPIWYRGGDARPLTLLRVQGAGQGMV